MDYSYTYTSGDATVYAVLLSILASFLVIIIIGGLILYIFDSIATYTMAKNKGISNPWLAWIPIANSYLMGKIIDEKVAFGSKVIPYAHIFLPLGPFVAGALSFIPFIGFLFPLAMAVYYYAALYRQYKLYKPDNAVLFLVLSIIFSFLPPFFLFAIRKKTPEEYLDDAE